MPSEQLQQFLQEVKSFVESWAFAHGVACKLTKPSFRKGDVFAYQLEVLLARTVTKHSDGERPKIELYNMPVCFSLDALWLGKEQWKERLSELLRHALYKLDLGVLESLGLAQREIAELRRAVGDLKHDTPMGFGTPYYPQPTHLDEKFLVLYEAVRALVSEDVRL